MAFTPLIGWYSTKWLTWRRLVSMTTQYRFTSIAGTLFVPLTIRSPTQSYIYVGLYIYIRRKGGLTFGYVAQEAIVYYGISYYVFFITPLLNWKTRCNLKFDSIQKKGEKSVVENAIGVLKVDVNYRSNLHV